MTRTTRWSDAMVGTFVLVGIVLVVAATMWARQASARDAGPVLTARFRDVGNAGVGNGVFIRGVRSGRIAALELGDAGWVHVRLRLDGNVALPDDPVVLLAAASLFGEWQATITSRSGVPDHPDVRRQLDEAAGADALLAGATLPDVAQLTTIAGRVADDVGAVAGRVRVAFDDSAASELRATIASTAELSGALATLVRSQSAEVEQVTTSLRGGSRSLAAASAALARAAARVDTATSDHELQRALDDAAAAAADVRAAAATLRALSGRAQATHAAVDRTVASAESLFAKANSDSGSLGLLMRDPSLYRNADSLLVELRALVGDVKANPKRYFKLEVF